MYCDSMSTTESRRHWRSESNGGTQYLDISRAMREWASPYPAGKQRRCRPLLWETL